MRNHPARLRRAIVCLVAVAATPFIGVSAAGAAEVTVEDGIGDVWLLDFDTNDFEPVPAPAQTNGDIVRTRIQHRLRKVVITTKYVQLASNRAGVLAVFMKTGKGEFTDAILRFGPRNRDGEVRLFTWDRRPPRVDCSASHRIDYVANKMRMSIPRSCLRFPEWVRFTGLQVRMADNGVTLDDAGSEEAFPERAWANRRLYRN